MKPIDELAKDYLFEGDYDGEYSADIQQLEALCKAYMQNRLNSLEAVAWNLRRADWQPNEYSPYLKNYDWAKESIPLYDISSLMEKE